MTVFVIFFAVAFGVSLIVAHVAYELCDRFQGHWIIRRESRDRIRKDLSYRKVL